MPDIRSTESVEALESAGRTLIAYKRALAAKKIGAGVAAFALALALNSYVLDRPYSSENAVLDVITSITGSGPINWLVRMIIVPAALIASPLFVAYTIYGYRKPLVAGTTVEASVRLFLQPFTPVAFPNYPASYVCLTSAAKSEAISFDKFKEFCKTTRKEWEARALEELGELGKSANVHVIDLKSCEAVALELDELRCTCNVMMIDTLKVQGRTSTGMPTLSAKA